MPHGLEVPADRPLDDLTAELTAMLGSTRPRARDGTAYPALAPGSTAASTTTCWPGSATAWPPGCGRARRGGHRHGLPAELLARWSSAECSSATPPQHLVPRRQGARVGRPDRDVVPARARPARLRARQGLGARGRPRRRRARRLAGSPHFGTAELTVLLDVIADRLLRPPTGCYLRRARPAGGGHDGGAAPQPGAARGPRALDRAARRAPPAPVAAPTTATPTSRPATPQAFLRALYLQLALAADPPAGPLRPAAGAGRRAAGDQPALPRRRAAAE